MSSDYLFYPCFDATEMIYYAFKEDLVIHSKPLKQLLDGPRIENALSAAVF